MQKEVQRVRPYRSREGIHERHESGESLKYQGEENQYDCIKYLEYLDLNDLIKTDDFSIVFF